MLGAIIGDIVGSPFEFHNIKTKDFPLFCEKSCFTDDTILTCAVAEHLLFHKPIEVVLKKWAEKYKNRTYENGTVKAFGEGFTKWVETGISPDSKTNGCVMRISPVLLKADTIKNVFQKADEITKITHNHKESINAVHAYIETGLLLQNKIPITLIKNKIAHKYNYDLNQTLEEIRYHYDRFYCSCKNSVPQAIICALNASSYEDALRNAVSLGGDSDTLACMAGGLAEIRFNIPTPIIIQAKKYIDKDILSLIDRFYGKNEYTR